MKTLTTILITFAVCFFLAITTPSSSEHAQFMKDNLTSDVTEGVEAFDLSRMFDSFVEASQAPGFEYKDYGLFSYTVINDTIYTFGVAGIVWDWGEMKESIATKVEEWKQRREERRATQP